MAQRSIVAAFVAFIVFGIGNAQATTPQSAVYPDAMDISGTWVMQGLLTFERGLLTSLPSTIFDPYNRYQVGRDSYEFVPTGGTTDDRGEQTWEYDVIYRTTDQWYYILGRNENRTIHHCGVTAVEYTGTASVVYLLDDSR